MHAVHPIRISRAVRNRTQYESTISVTGRHFEPFVWSHCGEFVLRAAAGLELEPANCALCSVIKLLAQMGTSLQQSLSISEKDAGLARVLIAVADAVSAITVVLRGLTVEESEGKNTFGDQQLNVDVQTDEIVFKHLRESNAVKTASSEEQTDCLDMGGTGFSVGFDPLDGSSIVGANFAVGSIFGIWPGNELVGRKGSEQVAAAYAVYGPRTCLVIALAQRGEGQSGHVQEYLLTPQADGNSQWILKRDGIKIGDKAIYAPANLRSAVENPEYQKLMQYWMGNKYTLRYSGGMVPDVHHILTKGGGVFANPTSKQAPAKLRLLYEAAPLGLVVEAAGGLAECSTGSVLDMVISQTDVRTSISLGSTSEVVRSRPAMQWQQE